MQSLLLSKTPLPFSAAGLAISRSFSQKALIFNAPTSPINCAPSHPNRHCSEQFLLSLLEVCKSMDQLKQIHSQTIKMGISSDPSVQNRVIVFCCTKDSGDVNYARHLFDTIPEPTVFIWNTLIRGYSRLECPSDGVYMYIGVLCACTHTGMVEKGREFFVSMTTQYGIKPSVTHYGCMVDLLGRAGNLREAHEFIENMPIEPNSIVWGSLLGACRIQRNVELAEMAANKILELEPGCSLIEMNGAVHEFVAGDQSHPQSKEIYAKLENMMQELTYAGYSPDTSEVFLDIGEEDKETAVYRHSEKLAIAYALISSGPGVAIRIVKNLRMCVDCHHMAKLVSQAYCRELIVRDRTRFHHFKHGSCSCNDFW